MKPQLQQLEDRYHPSFLLSGAVGQALVPPLTATLRDMGSAAADLVSQIATIIRPNTGPGSNIIAIGKASSDWQRIQLDRGFISTTVQADKLFINLTAMATAREGDPIDLIILRFAQFFGPSFNFFSPLDAADAQAASIINDPTLQADVNTPLVALNINIPVSLSIGQLTFDPTTSIVPPFNPFPPF